MINRIWRPIKEGFLGVFRHGAMSVSAAVAVTLTLNIISLFMMFTMNVGQLTQGIEQSVQISATVEYGKESAENEDRISLAIQNIEGVDTVTYSSKADEFQYYLNSFSDEKTREAFKPFEGENNPMHDAFYVTVKDGTALESVANQISEIDGIEAVDLQRVEQAVHLRFLLSGSCTLRGPVQAPHGGNPCRTELTFGLSISPCLHHQPREQQHKSDSREISFHILKICG